MKPQIHPQFYPTAIVTCACGATWTAGSTLKDIHTEICSSCHPFFTGKQKLVDTLGRVDKFRKRQEIAATSPIKIKKTGLKTTAVTHTQIKAAMKGQKAVKEKRVVGKGKDDKKADKKAKK